MPSFIWRNIDPEFWKKVQAKAAAEQIHIKDLLMKLLTQWLGVFMLAIVASSVVGCGDNDTTGPSPSVFAPPPVVTPTPAPSPAPPAGPPFSIRLDATGSVPADASNPWTGTIRTTLNPGELTGPIGASINCGNGTPTVQLSGPRATFPVACLFATAGTYQVTATATANTGFVARDSITVTVTAGAGPPSPAPPPTSTIQLVGERVNGGNGFAEWRFYAVNAASSIVMFNWDFGDGGGSSSATSTTTHVYTNPGTHTYTARVIGSTASGATSPATTDVVVTVP